MATKQDIKNLGIKIDSFSERLENKILQSEYRTIVRIGSVMALVIAAATAVIKLL